MSENSFDIVFLDIDMPDKNGFEMAAIYHNLCHEKKKIEGEIVMLSAFNLDQDIEEKMNHHDIKHYLMKPIRKGKIKKKIVSIAHGLDEQVKLSSLHERAVSDDVDFSFLDADFQEYLPRYLELKQEEMEDMIEAHKRMDSARVLSLCHKILGTAKSFGLNKMDKDVERVQVLAKKDYTLNQDAISRLVEQILKEHKELIEKLPFILEEQHKKE